MRHRLEAFVKIVGGTGSFAGDHGGTQRCARCALFSKRGTLIRLEDAFENITAAAKAGFDRLDPFYRKATSGIKARELLA